jgi:hypothetical protein
VEGKDLIKAFKDGAKTEKSAKGAKTEKTKTEKTKTEKTKTEKTKTEKTKTEKTEIGAFLEWIKESKYTVWDGDEQLKWKQGLVKIEDDVMEFLKSVDEIYTIWKGDDEIKPTAIMKVYKTEKIDTSKVDIKVDKNLDTDDMAWVDVLGYEADKLEKRLGKPLKNKGKKNRYEWKLKINGDVYSIYDWKSDAEEEWDDYDETEWHIGTTSDLDKNDNPTPKMKKDLKELAKYIECK